MTQPIPGAAARPRASPRAFRSPRECRDSRRACNGCELVARGTALRRREHELGSERGGGRRSGTRRPIHLPKEHGTMQAVLSLRGDEQTFLGHFVVVGVDDDEEQLRDLKKG